MLRSLGVGCMPSAVSKIFVAVLFSAAVPSFAADRPTGPVASATTEQSDLLSLVGPLETIESARLELHSLHGSAHPAADIPAEPVPTPNSALAGLVALIGIAGFRAARRIRFA